MSGDILQHRDEPLRYITDYQGQIIGKDEALPAESRETSINFAEGDEYFIINTHTQAVMEGLLSCPKFEVISIELALIKGTREHRNSKREEKVVGVKGRMPIGMLSIKKSRADNEIFRVVSPRIRTLDTSKLIAPSRPRRDKPGLKSTQKGRANKVTKAKAKRQKSVSKKAQEAWTYGNGKKQLGLI